MASDGMAGGPGGFQGMAAFADATPAHLDVPDLLATLLDRVRELLAADTAAVLLFDEPSGDLVATAASGIEEEVRQGIRIPLGEGFAGRIALEAAPVIIEDVDHATIRNPLLRERGIASLLGAPLVVDGHVIGVIHVGSLTRRAFGPDDVELLTSVADRVARAVDARRADVDRAAAGALQRSLVPGRLPAIAGLDLASRYLPGDEGGVGGDWYDLFVLPSGRVGVVIGDVVGRGLAAAVVMGRLRSALRAYALETLDPSDVLARLDRKLQHFEAGYLTTVLYGVLDPEFGSMTLCSAGHPLPVVAGAGREPAWLQAAVGPPLGIVAGARRDNIVVDLRAGTMLAFFTDGLVERPGESFVTGIQRLTSTLVAHSAEASCSKVIAELVGSQDRRDDVALLVLRRVEGGPLSVELPASPSSLAQLRANLRRWMTWTEVGAEDQQRVLLAVGEAASNAIEHAYGARSGTIDVVMSNGSATLDVAVSDKGLWRETPRGENRGRGLRIMESCADDMAVESTAGGTTVRLHFSLDRDGAP